MKTKESILYLVPKATYYDKKSVVVKEAKNLHQITMEEDRELYTYLLFFQDATYFSKSVIIQNLLGNSLHKGSNREVVENDPQRLLIEDELIYHALLNENMTHALKMLLSLKENKINNARTSRMILKFLFRRKNLDRISIKYKQKVKDLIIHALGKQKIHHIVEETKKGHDYYRKWISIYRNPNALEVIKFVFNKKQELSSEHLKDYQNVKEHFENNTVREIGKSNVPVEVMIGFNNFHKRYLSLTDLVSVGKVSDKQRIQLQNAVKKESNDQIKVELKVDLSKYGIMELYKFLYSNKDEETDKRDEAGRFMLQKVKEIQERSNPTFFGGKEFAVIVDLSDSHLGSKETHLHPLYKNLAMAQVLGGSKYMVGGDKDEFGNIIPTGDSNISKALLQAVKDGHQNIVILSDGYENVGSVDKVYQQLNHIGYNLDILHLNPVFSPKNFSFKTLGDSFPSLPYYDVENFENLELYHLLNSNPEMFKKVMRSKIETELFGDKQKAVSQ